MRFSKTSKIIASLILSIILIFSVVPTAFAAESFDRDAIPYEELIEEGYNKEEIDQAAQMMEAYAEAHPEKDEKSGNGTRIVANLSVVTRVKGTGHAWIYVENLTDEPLQVGHYTLPANEGVSVGLFSFTCEDGIGIYYNVESYCCNVHGGDGLVSITTDLDEEEMRPSFEPDLSKMTLSLDEMKPHTNPKYLRGEIGIGNAFADYFKPIARFDRERGIWYVFDGKVWQPDENALAVAELAKRLSDQLYTFALQMKTALFQNLKCLHLWRV